MKNDVTASDGSFKLMRFINVGFKQHQISSCIWEPLQNPYFRFIIFKHKNLPILCYLRTSQATYNLTRKIWGFGYSLILIYLSCEELHELCGRLGEAF